MKNTNTRPNNNQFILTINKRLVVLKYINTTYTLKKKKKKIVKRRFLNFINYEYYLYIFILKNNLFKFYYF